jgi:hypothetical protein
MAKKAQSNGYVEYTCPLCQDTYQYNGKAKDAKYFHNLEYHADMAAAVAEPVTVEPVVEQAPVVEAPVATAAPAATSVSDVTKRLMRLETLIAEKVSKEIALAKDEQAQYVDVSALQAQIEKIKGTTLPMLMSVPEGYRDNDVIDMLQTELASATSKLALAMMSPAYLRAEQAKAALDRATRIEQATKMVAQHNANAANVFSPIGKEWQEENAERFAAMLNGDMWIPRPKRDPKRIPFAQDLWWGLQTHAKYGLVNEDGTYVRPPLAANERTWEALECIVEEVFDELMAKYSFDFNKTKKFDMRVTLKQVDADGFIVDAETKVVPVLYALPRDEWLSRVKNVMHGIWKKTWNRRDVDIANALAELGYYGSGKEDLPREFCTWAGKQDAKTKLGRMTSMEYALLAAKGELPKDAPVVQTKASSRKKSK